MINVNQITAQLARMPDQALQRYAQMNKSDPYILSLALSESNRRREMRAGAQMSAPEQPKVVDQAIAGMGGLPTLPADNLRGMEQSMAAGGIVAFDKGGEVPRYAGEDEQLVRDRLRRQLYGLSFGRPDAAVMAVPRPVSALPRNEMPPKYLAPGVLNPAYTAYLQNEATRPRDVMEMGYDPERYPMPTAMAPTVYGGEQTKPAPTDKTAPAPTPAADGSAAPSSGSGLRTGTGYAGLQPYLGGGLGLTTSATGNAQELQNVRGMFTDEVPFAQKEAIDKYALAKRTGKEEGLRLLEEDIAKLGPGMEQAYARAQAREAKLGEREKEAGPMALIQAGLAIMGGESPYAMSNIGKGGGLGLKAYAESIDKLELARDKLDETFSRIDAFRENRADMNARAVRAAKAEIKDTYTEAEKLGLDALMKNTELNRSDARAVFDTMSRNRASMYEIGAKTALGIAGLETQERIAGERSALMRDIYGGEAKARAEIGKLQTKIMSELSKDMNYQSATPAQQEAMRAQRLRAEMANNPFLAPYAAGIGFTKAPPPGKMYDLTE